MREGCAATKHQVANEQRGGNARLFILKSGQPRCTCVSQTCKFMANGITQLWLAADVGYGGCHLHLEHSQTGYSRTGFGVFVFVSFLPSSPLKASSR